MQARIHRPDGGRILNVLGNMMLEKASSEDLGGGAAVFVQSIPPGFGPPEHVHADSDEFFYVLDGELDVWVDGSHAKLWSGMSSTLPRGVKHRFLNTGTRPVKVLAVVTPGTGARFFDDLDRERPQLPAEFAKLEAIVARHDISFAV